MIYFDYNNYYELRNMIKNGTDANNMVSTVRK